MNTSGTKRLPVTSTPLWGTSFTYYVNIHGFGPINYLFSGHFSSEVSSTTSNSTTNLSHRVVLWTPVVPEDSPPMHIFIRGGNVGLGVWSFFGQVITTISLGFTSIKKWPEKCSVHRTETVNVDVVGEWCGAKRRTRCGLSSGTTGVHDPS